MHSIKDLMNLSEQHHEIEPCLNPSKRKEKQENLLNCLEFLLICFNILLQALHRQLFISLVKLMQTPDIVITIPIHPPIERVFPQYTHEIKPVKGGAIVSNRIVFLAPIHPKVLKQKISPKPIPLIPDIISFKQTQNSSYGKMESQKLKTTMQVKAAETNILKKFNITGEVVLAISDRIVADAAQLIAEYKAVSSPVSTIIFYLRFIFHLLLLLIFKRYQPIIEERFKIQSTFKKIHQQSLIIFNQIHGQYRHASIVKFHIQKHLFEQLGI
ncbi:hypothetical protein TTHERM_000486589 (macronuclear) [Tetrahymena thermophila SB210]|uniref:Uncharacterized protein n=1 Tax=Tetrahymena thermophila (strain SB210) TaxID=312017 RepID=W7XI34_TETTS|nr:hypothetical protein TTHERM_000486589 [Tetrahymena thermophila SB210]EWS72949.1 hypothetical protein TTHERM_000486589 [Tetrahymena thermophila SB210]|eukprot:XP_012654516.1 hypothetical protein TTHERM_000486589 [Tetrahymena thermophila SB210]